MLPEFTGLTKDKENTCDKIIMSHGDPNPSPIPDQLAEFAIRLLKPGGAGVGGTYGLWSFFVEQNISKAIASILIGFCLSYCVRLLEPVHLSNQRRLQEAGQSIDQSIDSVIRQLLAKAYRAEDAYLLRQALDCEDYRSEGMGARENILVPVLGEVFVMLDLDFRSNDQGIQRQERRTANLQEIHQVWDFLAKAEQVPAYRQLAITAWGGYGKTTLLKYLTYIYGTRQHRQFKVPFRLPIFLPLRSYYKVITEDITSSLPDLVRSHHLKRLADKDPRIKKLPANWAQNILRKGNALVFMDGFDEVPEPQRPALSAWIMREMQQFDRSIFILTSRPKAYEDHFLESRLTRCWVRPLSPDQQASFVRQWYVAQEKLARGGNNSHEVERIADENAENLIQQIRSPNHPDLKDLAKIPLLLNLLAIYHRSEPSGVQLPSQRVELYQDICTLQLRKRPKAREITLCFFPIQRQEILQAVALTLMQRSEKLIPEADLLQLITEIFQSQKLDGDPQKFLHQIIDISELIVRQGLEGCEFTHLSFQEFLAAAEIKARQLEDLLYPHLREANRNSDGSWWRPTILLYASQTNPTNLIKEAIRQGAKDLASACLRVSPHTLDMEIKESLQLKTILQAHRYSNLEQLLQASQWQEADNETYSVMIKALDKQEGQLFDDDELIHFPSEVLRTINDLWQRYSQDLYSFSIQKKLYVQCGARLDGQYPGHEVWDKFASEVGWLVKGEWIDRRDPKFLSDDITQRHGHFPCGAFLGGYDRRARWSLIPLMSHKEL